MRSRIKPYQNTTLIQSKNSSYHENMTTKTFENSTIFNKNENTVDNFQKYGPYLNNSSFHQTTFEKVDALQSDIDSLRSKVSKADKLKQEIKSLKQ